MHLNLTWGQEYQKMKNLFKGNKHLFLLLFAISLILMMFVTTILWYFVSPRLHEISSLFAAVILTSLRVFYIIVLMGILLIFITSYSKFNLLISSFAVRLTIQFLFPVTMFIGRIAGISKEKIRNSFVHVNNSFIKKMKVESARILILLPHCIQNYDCPYRLTYNFENCAKCGKCNIGDIISLKEKYNVNLAIATGGTLARRIIMNVKPKFIIAVACERDLVDGIKDVFPIPVYGVLNDRPEGPCINTIVSIEKIEDTIKRVIRK